MVNITLAENIKEEDEVMSPGSTDSDESQVGGPTPIKEGDLARVKGDRDGHVFRVMRILEKCVNVCCMEHTNIDFLEKVDD